MQTKDCPREPALSPSQAEISRHPSAGNQVYLRMRVEESRNLSNTAGSAIGGWVPWVKRVRTCAVTFPQDREFSEALNFFVVIDHFPLDKRIRLL